MKLLIVVGVLSLSCILIKGKPIDDFIDKYLRDHHPLLRLSINNPGYHRSDEYNNLAQFIHRLQQWLRTHPGACSDVSGYNDIPILPPYSVNLPSFHNQFVVSQGGFFSGASQSGGSLSESSQSGGSLSENSQSSGTAGDFQSESFSEGSQGAVSEGGYQSETISEDSQDVVSEGGYLSGNPTRHIFHHLGGLQHSTGLHHFGGLQHASGLTQFGGLQHPSGIHHSFGSHHSGIGHHTSSHHHILQTIADQAAHHSLGSPNSLGAINGVNQGIQFSPLQFRKTVNN